MKTTMYLFNKKNYLLS